MSTPCPVIPQCCDNALYNFKNNELFYNAAISGSCSDDPDSQTFSVPFGMFTSQVSQEDADNQAESYLDSLLEAGCLPVVQSATINSPAGKPFSYQIVSTNNPTSYDATILPSGLSINHSTGLITGTLPSTLTTYTVAISATNTYGTGNGTLTIHALTNTTFNFHSGDQTPFNVTSLQIALDSGSYQAVFDDTDYVVLNQVKIKAQLLGTWTDTDFTDLEPTITHLTGTRTLTTGSQTVSSGHVSSFLNPGSDKGQIGTNFNLNFYGFMVVAIGDFSQTDNLTGSVASGSPIDFGAGSPAGGNFTLTTGTIEITLVFT